MKEIVPCNIERVSTTKLSTAIESLFDGLTLHYSKAVRS